MVATYAPAPEFGIVVGMHRRESASFDEEYLYSEQYYS